MDLGVSPCLCPLAPPGYHREGRKDKASRVRGAERKAKLVFPELSLSPPPRATQVASRSTLALGSRSPRDLAPPAHGGSDGRRPLAEGGEAGSRRQATDGGGRGSPAPPRLAGGADRERALCGVALGGRRQDPLPHPLETRGPAGLPGAAGRGALQVARTCAPPGKKNILRSRQEPPGDVTELVAHRTDQASCPASPCSLASSVTSALGALWHCRLSCPLLQLLPRHHPLSLLPARPLLTSTPPLVPPSAPPAPSLRLQRLRLRRRLHPPCFLPIHPSPLSSLSLLSPSPSPLSPPLSPLSPHLCHFCPHVYHLCPHLYLLCPLISATSVPMSITSIPTSVTSVPSSLPPLSPCLSPLSPPLSPLSPHLCHLCPHVYHLCPHLCHLCPHLYRLCPLPAHSVLTCLSLAQ
ncbi:proline-rich protein 36-like isoform X3 [Panthera pardus]|uniref:Proline-rich protein 36-like isoform X3 n=1 Tax=Panthera pardus TaxID=9691 RepID=A0A9W2UJ70_PANPR|nr:proline-rich protein 36-like isoform X3 [Panthera pardus]